MTGDQVRDDRGSSPGSQGIKFGNYDKVDSKGMICENVKLEQGDIMMAKVSTIKENRNDPTKQIKYEEYRQGARFAPTR